jgi:hypothetical protein
MKARITLLHNTESEWAKLNTFRPELGEIVVYDPDETFDYVRIKVGDGKHYIQELDFCIDRAVEAVLAAQRYSEFIDAGRITEYVK